MKNILSLLAISAFPILAADQAASTDKFTQDFLKHWSTAKQLTLAVADAMPEADYTFKPNAEEMSFGEQMVHIASANYSYCSRIKGEKSPFSKPATADHKAADQALNASFDYCTEAIQGAKDLGAMKGSMDVGEVMLGAYAHMAHHRGQAEVYLRVKGITPPTYKF